MEGVSSVCRLMSQHAGVSDHAEKPRVSSVVTGDDDELQRTTTQEAS